MEETPEHEAPDPGGDPGVVDKAKSTAGDLAEKAKPALDKAGVLAAGMFDKAKGLFKKDQGSGGGTGGAAPDEAPGE